MGVSQRVELAISQRSNPYLGMTCYRNNVSLLGARESQWSYAGVNFIFGCEVCQRNRKYSKELLFRTIHSNARQLKTVSTERFTQLIVANLWTEFSALNR